MPSAAEMEVNDVVLETRQETIQTTIVVLVVVLLRLLGQL